MSEFLVSQGFNQMITAEQAYSQAVLGEAFRRNVDREIKKAAKRGDLYFKLPYSEFPKSKNIDDILKALHIMGYRFVESKDNEHVVLDFSFGWMDTPSRDS